MNKNDRKSSILLLCFLALFSCNSPSKENIPLAIKGVIILQEQDISGNKLVNLNGEWEFYWNQLLTPDEFTENSVVCAKKYARIPCDWTEYSNFSGEKSSSNGYGTYRLKIHINSVDKDYALYIPDMSSAYKIYINGKIIIESGEEGETEDDIIQIRMRKLIKIRDAEKDIDIIIQIPNFQFPAGGIHDPLFFGKEKPVNDKYLYNTILSSLLFGIFFVMALYHFTFFSQCKGNKAILFFGFLCFIYSLRVLCNEHLLYEILRDLYSFNFDLKLEYNAYYFTVPCFMYFFKYLFPDEFNSKIIKIYCVSGIIFASFILLSPPGFFIIYIRTICHVITLSGSLYALYAISRAVINKRIGALFTLFGFVVIFLAALNDILYENYIIRTTPLYHFAFIVFIITQSLVLSRIFNNLFRKTEELSFELKNKNWLLEQRVNENIHELSMVNKRCKELDKAKNIFYANIFHEFRTPLMLIQYPVKAIMEGNHGKTISKNDKLFKTLYRNCNKLLELINNLQNFTQIELKKITLNKQRINIITLIKYYIAKIESFASMKEISLTYVDNINKQTITMIDPDLFEDAFLNLLNNIFELASPGGEITIILNLDTSKEEIIISVIDVGISNLSNSNCKDKRCIGISEKKHANIFEKFHQVDEGEDNKYEGIGIGLLLAKEIISLHEGEISVISDLGKDLTFTIRLPLNNSNIIGKGSENEKKITFRDKIKDYNLDKFYQKKKQLEIMEFDKNKKILFIIEDNSDMQELLFTLLNSTYNIFLSHNGKEALEKMENSPKPDLLIVDIMMPIMDGMEFYKKLKQKKEFMDIPLIFLTARNSIKDKIKGLSEGAIDYIYKPFSIEELKIKIENIIKREYIVKTSYKERIQDSILKVLNEIDDNVTPSILLKYNFNKFGITAREKDIILLLLQGYQDCEIANKINISVRTVSNHLQNIYRKVKVNNRVELLNTLNGLYSYRKE